MNILCVCVYKAFGYFVNSAVCALAKFKINLMTYIEIVRYLIEIYIL